VNRIEKFDIERTVTIVRARIANCQVYRSTISINDKRQLEREREERSERSRANLSRSSNPRFRVAAIISVHAVPFATAIAGKHTQTRNVHDTRIHGTFDEIHVRTCVYFPRRWNEIGRARARARAFDTWHTVTARGREISVFARIMRARAERAHLKYSPQSRFASLAQSVSVSLTRTACCSVLAVCTERASR